MASAESGAKPVAGNGARRLLSIGTVALVVGLAVAAALAAWLAPASLAEKDFVALAAGVIFAGSYLALAVGRIPFLVIDRAGVALVGACLMVLSGALPLEDAYRAINLDTLTLLLGTMIVVANLRLSGFFAIATAWAARRAHAPIVLLAAVTAVSGLFSAFLVNDAICVVLTPIVLDVTLALNRRPVPYLLAVAMASNVGSTATITGNPQNIMIGSFSGIGYGHFAAVLAPVAAAGLVLTVALIALAHRSEFLVADRIAAETRRVRANRTLVVRSLLAAAAMVALFFAGQPPAKAAITIGGLLLLDATGPQRAGLCRDRLVAAADVRGAVHHRRRRAKNAADAVGGGSGGRSAPGAPADAERRYGGHVEHRQQCSRRAGVEAIRADTA